jgi:acyl carrier protein
VTRREVEQRARLVIVRELACPPAKVTDAADFRADLGADSLDMAHLPAAFEDEFNVPITDDEAEFCQTVGTAIDVIHAKIENGRKAA